MSDAKRLMCVSPDSTREFSIGPGKFKIGVLPREIEAKITADAREDGTGGESIWTAVQYGVKGHDGLWLSEDTPVPFNTTKDDQDRTIVADDTMEIYRSTVFDGAALLNVLGTEVFTIGGGDLLIDRQKKMLKKRLAELEG